MRTISASDLLGALFPAVQILSDFYTPEQADQIPARIMTWLVYCLVE